MRGCQGRAYGLAWHYLRSIEDARDVTQEAFVRVYRQLDAFEEGRFLAWLLRITRNLCIDQLRRRKARPPAEDLRADEHESALPPDTAPNPEQAWLTDGRRTNGPRGAGAGERRKPRVDPAEGDPGSPARRNRTPARPALGTVKSRSTRARVELARQVVAVDPSYAETSRPRG